MSCCGQGQQQQKSVYVENIEAEASLSPSHRTALTVFYQQQLTLVSSDQGPVVEGSIYHVQVLVVLERRSCLKSWIFRSF